MTHKYFFDSNFDLNSSQISNESSFGIQHSFEAWIEPSAEFTLNELFFWTDPLRFFESEHPETNTKKQKKPKKILLNNDSICFL
jgi:hypothetical protein